MKFSNRRLDTLGRAAAGMVVCGLFAAPIGSVIWHRVSLLVPQHEFIGYRFFSSLSVLAGEARNVLIVQGVPMGVLQHAIVFTLTTVLGMSPTAFRTLDIFAWATLALAYGFSCLAILTVWMSRTPDLLDRVVVSFAALVPWYCWSADSLLYAPDYWPFELAYGLVSAAWVVTVARQTIDVQSPTVWAKTGFWCGLGSTLKVSLPALGVLPLVVALRGRSVSVRRDFKAVAAGAVAVALGVAIPLWLYFLGHVGDMLNAARTFASFVAPGLLPGAHSAFQALDYTSLGDVVTSPRAAFARVTVLSMILAAAAAAWSSRSQPASSRRFVTVLLGVVAIGLAGHVATVASRPSSTSVFDLSLFALIAAAVLATCIQGRYRSVFVAVVFIPLVIIAVRTDSWRVVMRMHALEDNNRSTATIQQVHDYVQQLNRRVVLFLPDNRWTGQVIEQVILYHGGLMRSPLDGVSLRSRLLPNTELLGASPSELWKLQTDIDEGDAVIWAHPSGLPATVDEYPVLKALTDDPHAVMASWTHQSLGPSRTIYVGYLTSPPAESARRMVTAPHDPPPERLSQLLGVPVDAAPEEPDQYLVRAKRENVDISKIGRIHLDVGYSIGVTLPDGHRIGLRFDPPDP